MSVRIRLQRRGRKNRPFYHIVAADSRKQPKGRFLESLGYYDPLVKPLNIKIHQDRLQYWYQVGAQLTDSAAKLVKMEKIVLTRKNLEKS